MKEPLFLIIRGQCNCGKTTLCAEIYSELLKHVNQEHIFGEPYKEMEKILRSNKFSLIIIMSSIIFFKSWIKVGNRLTKCEVYQTM